MRVCVFPLSMHPLPSRPLTQVPTLGTTLCLPTQRRKCRCGSLLSVRRSPQHSMTKRSFPRYCFIIPSASLAELLLCIYACMYVGHVSLVFLTMALLSSCVCPLYLFLFSPHSTLFLFFFFLLLHTCLYLLSHSILPLPPHSPLFKPSFFSLPNPSHFLLTILPHPLPSLPLTLPHSPPSLPSEWLSP